MLVENKVQYPNPIDFDLNREESIKKIKDIVENSRRDCRDVDDDYLLRYGWASKSWFSVASNSLWKCCCDLDTMYKTRCPRKYPWSLKMEHWVRSDEMQEKKWDHMEALDKLHPSREKYIKSTILAPPREMLVEFNPFPYDTPADIFHLTLWSIHSLTTRQIDEAICKWISAHLPFAIRWNFDSNPERSIDIFHIHAYVQIPRWAIDKVKRWRDIVTGNLLANMNQCVAFREVYGLKSSRNRAPWTENERGRDRPFESSRSFSSGRYGFSSAFSSAGRGVGDRTSVSRSRWGGSGSVSSAASGGRHSHSRGRHHWSGYGGDQRYSGRARQDAHRRPSHYALNRSHRGSSQRWGDRNQSKVGRDDRAGRDKGRDRYESCRSERCDFVGGYDRCHRRGGQQREGNHRPASSNSTTPPLYGYSRGEPVDNYATKGGDVYLDRNFKGCRDDGVEGRSERNSMAWESRCYERDGNVEGKNKRGRDCSLEVAIKRSKTDG